LLQGYWKLQVSERPKQDWLFNLKIDPTEKNNLASAMPDTVLKIKAALAAIDAEQVKPLWPALLEGPVRIDHPLGFPSQPGDEYIYWAN
jgi:hypothetical protein